MLIACPKLSNSNSEYWNEGKKLNIKLEFKIALSPKLECWNIKTVLQCLHY